MVAPEELIDARLGPRKPDSINFDRDFDPATDEIKPAIWRG